MKFFTFIFCIWLITSCSSKPDLQTQPQSSVSNNLVNHIEVPKEEKPLETLPTISGKIALPIVKEFGVFRIIRNSDQKDGNGWMIPPFKEAEVQISLYNKPQVGEKVTILPLKVNIEPFQLTITEFLETEAYPCNDLKKNFYGDVIFEKINNKKILEIEPVENNVSQMPFEFLAIYPAVSFAKSIEKAELTTEMLPKGVSVETVKGAVDLDNDKRPDILEILFCCSNSSIAPNDTCKFICQKTFKKIGGKWKLINSADHC